jgi:hypothetical protein
MNDCTIIHANTRNVIVQHTTSAPTITHTIVNAVLSSCMAFPVSDGVAGFHPRHPCPPTYQ